MYPFGTSRGIVTDCDTVIPMDLQQSVDVTLIRGNVVSVRSNSMISRKMSSNSLLLILCEAYDGDPEGLGQDIKIYAEQGMSLKEIVEDLISNSEDSIT